MTEHDDRRLSLQLILHCNCFEMLFFLHLQCLSLRGSWVGLFWVGLFFFCIAVFFAFLSFLHLRLLRLRGSWVDWFGVGGQDFGRTTTHDFRCNCFCIAVLFCIAVCSAFAAS